MVLPLLLTPVTDLLFYSTPRQLTKYPDHTCSKVFLKLGDCFEAYGYERGKTKCSDLFYDLCECQEESFQRIRYLIIQRERMKQFRDGKRPTPFEEHPPIDSFVYF